MRGLIFFLIYSLSTSVFALTVEQNVSYELKTNNVNQVKPYLLHEAILQVMTQKGPELGINIDQIKTKLNERFETYFEAYKNRKFRESFGQNYSQEMTPEQKEQFVQTLDKDRAGLFLKSSRLEQVVDSYGYKEIKRQEKSDVWDGKVVLNLNPAKLKKLNERLLSPGSMQYSKLLLITEVNLLGMSWAELELDRATSFTDPLMASWLKWFESNAPNNVEEIEVCQGECLGLFNKWQDLPQEEGMIVPEELLNGVWLKVSFNLIKANFTKGLNEWEFSWDGNLILLDMNTKKILASYHMPMSTKSWRGLGQKDLNSKLASAMYATPLTAFNKAVKKLQDSSRLNRLSRLVISGHRHLGDVSDLIELLRKEGQSLGLELQWDLFTQKEAQLLCFYQGEEKSFTDLLSRIKELKSSHSYNVVNEFTGVRHVLKLIAE